MTDARAQLVMDSLLPMVQAGFMVSLPLAMISFVCGILIAIGVALVRISPSDNILHHILLFDLIGKNIFNLTMLLNLLIHHQVENLLFKI